MDTRFMTPPSQEANAFRDGESSPHSAAMQGQGLQRSQPMQGLQAGRGLQVHDVAAASLIAVVVVAVALNWLRAAKGRRRQAGLLEDKVDVDADDRSSFEKRYGGLA